MHESQLQAYEAAARTALEKAVQEVVLPSELEQATSSDEQLETILSKIPKPDWKVKDTVWEEAWMTPLRQRAAAAAMSSEDTTNNNTTSNNDNGNNEQSQDEVEMQDAEDDEEEEEGDEEDDGQVEQDEETKQAKPVMKKSLVPKKRVVATKAGKGLLKKKALGTGTATSKQTGTAPGQRAVRGRRARRGGRGGGAGGAAK